MIFDGVIGTTGNVFGNLSPPITKFIVSCEQDFLFLCGPRLLGDGGV